MNSVNFVPKEVQRVILSSKFSEKCNKQVFYKKAVLTNFAIFKEKHLCWNLFFNKNSGLQACSFIQNKLQHRCFFTNIDKFLRTIISKNIYERLILRLFHERFPKWTNNIEVRKTFSIKKKKKSRSKTQLYKKNVRFHDVLYHFVFLYFSTACQSVISERVILDQWEN